MTLTQALAEIEKWRPVHEAAKRWRDEAYTRGAQYAIDPTAHNVSDQLLVAVDAASPRDDAQPKPPRAA